MIHLPYQVAAIFSQRAGAAAGAGWKIKEQSLACLTWLFVLFLAPAVSAQQFPPDTEGLILLANAEDAGIELRWAPATPEGWPRGRQNGYTLSRELAGRDGTLLPAAEQRASRQVLLDGIRPQPELSWQPLADTSDFALTLAAMIYGQEDAPEDPGVLAQQHGLALFAADHDFPAAIHGALGYLDTDVAPGAIYRYLISDGVNTAERLVRRNVRISPPAPVPVSPEVKTKYVTLAWNRAKTDGYYSSYHVERSDNGGRTFFRLNKLPLVQILNESNYDTLQYYQDTFPLADIEYQYRITGTTPFARQGPYSEVIRVTPLPELATLMPRISEMSEDVEKNYRISWQIPVGSQDRIAYFEVQRSRVGFEGFTPRSGRIPASERSWIEENPETGYFYMVVAFDDRGIPFGSPVRLMTLVDRDPPRPPRGLTGSIDTLGNVQLAWATSLEPDVKGYRVYFANRPEGYFPQITETHTLDTTYAWQVTMDTRAEAVYFRVKAVDYQGNYSQFSPTLKLERPDFRPPTEPVIKSVSSSTERVTLRLAPSSSDDVVYHLIQRSPAGEATWTDLDTLRLPSTDVFEWSDSSGLTGVTYDYRLTAVDDAQLRSSSISYPSRKTDTGEREPIENFGVEIAAGSTIPLISWTYPSSAGLQGFQLYRSVNDGPMRKYRLLNADSPGLRLSAGRFTYLDRDVTSGQRYRYKMMAVFWNGGWSGFTEVR